jgi:hypothetical protein
VRAEESDMTEEEEEEEEEEERGLIKDLTPGFSHRVFRIKP